MNLSWKPLQLGFFVLLSRTTLADIIVVGGNVTVARFKDMQSTFGPEIPDDGIDGYLAVADPPHACSPVVKPPMPPMNETLPWILLIKRGVCNFDTKVVNAQNAGYIAAIVYDNNTSRNLIPMSGPDDGSAQIPSVFISYADGLALQTWFLASNGYYIRITQGYTPFSLNAILLPFAIVVGICFLVLSLVLVVKYVKDRRRRQRHRLPKSQLKKLALRKYKKGEGNDVCAICLEEFEEGDKLRLLPCHHQYHVKCVDPWLLNNKRVCPVCKRKVIPGDDSDEEGSTGQGTSSEPSEHTPLLAANVGPLDNDMPVQQPSLLINVDYASDEENDADNEADQDPRLILQEDDTSPPTTSRNSAEEPDVPLIRLGDLEDVPQRRG